MNANKTSIQDILQNIRSPKQKYLVAKISLFAFALELIVYIINGAVLKNDDIASLIFSEIGAILFFITLGLAGFIVIIRKEMPQVITVRGKSAIFYGLIWCGISWALAIRYIYFLINDVVNLL